ncbi:MAG: hypothetical protein CVV42_19675 [Candidatus Riflebacteria bacterium HGW-Riflebacteria-2]|jgi:hypothetical protein|nr:MAG: hypothetical protein CVV42_19675 [Candidatus Riflebacteria bacterium HGW-Riflebacteria-2]
MGILDFLFGGKEDPTKEWPVQEFAMPDFDLSDMSFGPLHFGCELSLAYVFGRPDLFTWRGSDYCELLYARHGFQIDFENGCLRYIAFFIGPDSLLPDHPKMVFAKPWLKKIAQFTSATNADGLKKILGDASSEDFDNDEIILTFSRSGLLLEFELTTEAFLKRWNIFPEAG